MRFHLTTLGCPKNEVDAEMMRALLERAGHQADDAPRRADVLVVVTCGFIATARDESYAVLADLARKKRRGQWLVAAGCLAQRSADELLARVPEVDAVIGTQAWPEIVALFEQLRQGTPPRTAQAWAAEERALVASVQRRPDTGASAYLKIADGCDAACGFCAIPLIKGPQRSKAPTDVLREARELVAGSVREIVLIAQDTTAYGRDLADGSTLSALLRALAQAVPTLDWLRVLYAYPQHVTAELVETLAGLPQVCHYLDLPLQHGHPDVLRRMRRPHDLEQVYATLDRLRQAMPDVALRSTFIVGYPGETEDEFEALLAFMRIVAFDHVGIFAFSREEGTYAATLPQQVPAEVVAERYERAMLAQQELSLARNQAQVGRELDILVEGCAEGLAVGRSYREAPEIDGLVLLPGQFQPGTLITARIVGAQEYDLVATPRSEQGEPPRPKLVRTRAKKRG